MADGGTEPWRVRVGSMAVRDCGPMLAVQWLACGAVLAETHAEIFLQLPEPVAVRIGGTQRLAPAGDLATLVGLPELTANARPPVAAHGGDLLSARLPPVRRFVPRRCFARRRSFRRANFHALVYLPMIDLCPCHYDLHLEVLLRARSPGRRGSHP